MEEKNINQKNNKGLVIVIIILVLIIISMGLYIAYSKGLILSNIDKKENEINNNKTLNNNNENEKDNTNNEIKELDISKCINNNATYSNPTDVEENVGLSMTVNSDKKSVTLSIDWAKFGPLSTASSYSSSVESYQINGFTKNVKSAFVGEVGQDSMGIKLFYVMDDNTVEYTPMFIEKKDSQNNTYYDINYTYDSSTNGNTTGQHFVTNGTISNVLDVVKLYTANVSNGSSYITTIGAKADGSFYDLGSIIQ